MTLHAESNVTRAASRAYGGDVLKDCTLYTNTEPSVTCSEAIACHPVEVESVI
jgi:tRNA(Arg) A34 adenosine deaminase TadA